MLKVSSNRKAVILLAEKRTEGERPKLNREQLMPLLDEMGAKAFSEYVCNEVLLGKLLPYASQLFGQYIKAKGWSISYAAYQLGLADNPKTNSVLTRMLKGTYRFSIPARKLDLAKTLFFPSSTLDEFLFGEKIQMEAFPVDVMLINTIRGLNSEQKKQVKQYAKEHWPQEVDILKRFEEYKIQANTTHVAVQFARYPKLHWLYSGDSELVATRTKQWALLCILAGISADYLMSLDYADVDFYYYSDNNIRLRPDKKILRYISPLTLEDKLDLLEMAMELSK